MRIAIINGPNLNLLGQREPEIYGHVSFDEYFAGLKAEFPNVELTYFQSNIEGELIDRIQDSSDVDAIVLNAGGYTHTSVAIADGISAIDVPVLEVHISNVLAREEVRKLSLISSACLGSISGLGLDGYRLAILHFISQHA